MTEIKFEQVLDMAAKAMAGAMANPVNGYLTLDTYNQQQAWVAAVEAVGNMLVSKGITIKMEGRYD